MTNEENISIDKPYTTEIKKIILETPQIKTIIVSFLIDGKIPKVIPTKTPFNAVLRFIFSNFDTANPHL